MAILDILEFPDPLLRTIARPVEQVDESIRQLVADMLETMYHAEGIGLAATQVNVHKRVVVIDTSEDRNQPQVFINPRIKILNDATMEYQEGCLSVPGYYEKVERPSAIKIAALDTQGEKFILEPDGVLAVCIQHEIDHLNGKLFVDYISTLKRNRIKQKLQKERRLA
ncbi:peptide deformylase [Pseudomonadales bacterium]|jgi:peptide deformylase|nr:peptide deformylase [Pseudomonadales bacterium]MDA8789999.1 peptide deformylase [Pseudomonadales bacterium]MDB4362730.1 peptide deformylase [Pseudomonadales bacterium]